MFVFTGLVSVVFVTNAQDYTRTHLHNQGFTFPNITQSSILQFDFVPHILPFSLHTQMNKWSVSSEKYLRTIFIEFFRNQMNFSYNFHLFWNKKWMLFISSKGWFMIQQSLSCLVSTNIRARNERERKGRISGRVLVLGEREGIDMIWRAVGYLLFLTQQNTSYTSTP